MMALTAFILVRLRDLFAVIMLSGVFSLLAATLYVALDAVDVAFTEAAVGAGVSTVLFLGALTLTGSREKVHPSLGKSFPAFLICLATGALLVHGTLDMPRWGDSTAAIHQHVAPRFIEKSAREIGVPNIVTSVLASYRGYDTLGETTVVFTAAAGVVALIGGGLSRRRREEDRDEARAPDTQGNDKANG